MIQNFSTGGMFVIQTLNDTVSDFIKGHITTLFQSLWCNAETFLISMLLCVKVSKFHSAFYSILFVMI